VDADSDELDMHGSNKVETPGVDRSETLVKSRFKLQVVSRMLSRCHCCVVMFRVIRSMQYVIVNTWSRRRNSDYI